ncbi:MAG: hypothetical protein V3U80_08425 [Flavobacteriaceae bacterium]
MNPLILILLAVVAVAVLAYLIVNVIPKKLHPILSLLFLALIVWLGSLIYKGIMAPVKFKVEKEARYTKVIDNLKMIRDAQVAHRKIAGGYIVNPQDLINYVDTAKYPITETKNIQVNKSHGTMTYKVDKKVVNITGYTPVVDEFRGRDYKNMFTVPGSTTKITMEADTIVVGGITSQVFTAYVAKKVVLAGLPNKMVKDEDKALGGITVKGDKISVGSLESVKVIGNWPPFYDNKK